MGVVASVVGVAGGLAIAGLLKGLFDAFGFSLPAGGLTVRAGGVTASVLIGLVVTVASGLAPAVRASRTAPVAALRDSALDRSAASTVRAVSGVVVAGAGVAMVLFALVGGGSAMGLAGLGALLTLVGVVVVGPVVARPVSGVLGAPLARLRGVTGVLARRNAMRNPRRTSGSAAALMIGVGVVTLFTVFAASLRASVEDRVTESVRADLVISGGQFGGGGLSPELAGDLEALPEVAGAVGLGTGVALVDGRSAQLGVADVATLAGLIDLDVAGGSLTALTPSQVAVARTVADDRGWSVGSPVSLAFVDGTTVGSTVGAVYERSDVAGDYLVSRQAWQPARRPGHRHIGPDRPAGRGRGGGGAGRRRAGHGRLREP